MISPSALFSLLDATYDWFWDANRWTPNREGWQELHEMWAHRIHDYVWEDE